MHKVAIIAAKRTPIGNFGSVFKDISAVDLGTIVIKNILEETAIDAKLIQEVIVGNVLAAGQGQNIARQISIRSGISVETPAFTINKVCGSGMKAVELAANEIKLGNNEIVIAGGVENMSQAPYLIKDARWGARMGNKSIEDLMICDGLTDIFNNYHMGITAENLATEWNISREEQDKFATASQNKAEKAIASGRFKDEIVKIHIPQKKGEDIVIDTDEFPRKAVTVESLSKLKPAFKNDGTVTAANSSGINDGAAFVLLMSQTKAEELGLTPIAYWEDSATAGVDPSIMGYAPVPAIKNLLKKTGKSLDDIQLLELNEAFAAQSIAVLKGLTKEFGAINHEIINVNGGAIALGHPIGASGARIIVTLIHEMNKRKTQRGVASLCIGGGMGIACSIVGNAFMRT